MKPFVALGLSTLLVLTACGDDRSAGGRVGTENTVRFGCVVKGNPTLGVSVHAYRHGELPAFLGGNPLVDSAVSDSLGNVYLTFPADLRYVDLQVRANMRGMNARAVDLKRSDTFELDLQPTGILVWEGDGAENPCPAQQCGIWFEGTDYGVWSSDTLALWADAPNGTYWPIVWFRDSLGLRLVRFEPVDLKFTTSYTYASDLIPKYQVLYEGLNSWPTGCRVKLPVEPDSLNGIPRCQ